MGVTRSSSPTLFAWLLDAEGTHQLGDAFQRIFVDAVNQVARNGPIVPFGQFSVRQEVDTIDGEGMDIADLVLESDDAVLVIENYYVSDGHGHSYSGYLNFGARDGKLHQVVMLCGSASTADLADGWQHSAVVTHPDLVSRLVEHVERVDGFDRDHPQQRLFFEHMHRHFVKGRRMNDGDLVRFIEAMCAGGEAERYGWKNREAAAISFADTLRDHALERFAMSVEVLKRLKAAVGRYGAELLLQQLNEAFGSEVIGSVYSRYTGRYEWTVGFFTAADPDKWLVQIKFGPSAWFANEKDGYWKTTVLSDEADYNCLFITHGVEVRQSSVTLQEVLDGLAVDDTRLRDELVSMLGEPPSVALNPR